jgi:acyl-CoA synthetase (AMP-forming)/AMP-acid ligase II
MYQLMPPRQADQSRPADPGECGAAPNVARLLADHPAGSHEPFLCSVDEEWTAGQFRALTESVALELSAAGVQPGQAVVTRHPGPVDLAAIMFAVWSIGAVYVPVNTRSVDYVLASVPAAALLTTRGTRKLYDAGRYGLEVASVTWRLGTSPPKPRVRTHSGYRDSLQRMLGQARCTSPAEDPSPYLVPLPPASNAGICNLLFGLALGAGVVVMERFHPEDFAHLVGRYAVHSAALPASAMAMLADSDAVFDLTPLEHVRNVTARLSPATAERFQAKFGVRVLEGGW